MQNNSSRGRGLDTNGDKRGTQQRNRAGKHKNRIKTLTINYNQALIELKNRQTDIFMLKKGSGKSNVR